MTSRQVSLLSLAPTVFLPTLIFETGIGALAPMIALSGSALGASAGTAGLILALQGVGQIVGDMPAGALAARVGDRKAMLIAASVAVVSLSCCALATRLWELGLAVTVTGAANAMIMLGRVSYLTEVIPPQLRARAMSTSGGMGRVGSFVGPFLGAWVVHGRPVRDVYWLAVGAALATILVLIFVRDVAGAAPVARGHVPVSVRSVFSGHRRMFLTLGTAVLLVGAVRATRQTVLPLWAQHLGENPSTTSIVFGLAGLVDTMVFYPSGKVMDQAGRLWVAVPSMVVLGLTLSVLPFTNGLASLTAVAMLMGLGNGIGSGMLMTLGADVAPAKSRAQFLGVWQLFGDSGNAAGPLLVSVAALLGSLVAGISIMGVVGLVAAGALLRWVPRHSPFATTGTRTKSTVVAKSAVPDTPSPDRPASPQ